MTYGVVIVAWNGQAYLPQCLRSVFEQTLAPQSIVVVDNGSDDLSRDVVQALKPSVEQLKIAFTTIDEPVNTGFTRGANTGIRALLADPAVDTAVLLNQDAELDREWASNIAAQFNATPRTGAIGSKILMPNGRTIQHAGGYIDMPRFVGKHFGHHQSSDASRFAETREVEFVTAAAIALNVDALQQVGLFDEVFSPGYYEDVDLCARLREARWRVSYLPAARAIHAESSSFSQRAERLALSNRNRLIYALRWLAEDGLREEFCRAERAHAVTATAEERRALGLAYLQVMLMLPDALDTRIAAPPRRERRDSELIEMLADLRRCALGDAITR